MPAAGAGARGSAVIPPFLVAALALLLSTLLIYNPDGFSPELTAGPSIAVPDVHSQVLLLAERVGEGQLHGPEDLAYDEAEKMLYTSCADGSIRRGRLEAGGAPDFEDWAHTGGRPLGVAFDVPRRRLIVADANRGLLKVEEDKAVEVLTDEADGVKFRMADGVDVASDGMIYFTDASYKYTLDDYVLDVLEGRPHGRLMSFDPLANLTVVLAHGLYFANGVAVAPDHQSVIYCETVMRRCTRYYIKGPKKGTLADFSDNLPGLPDNIEYDVAGGHYWIGLSTARTLEWDLMVKYPFIRRIVYILAKLRLMPFSTREAGVLSVSLDGEPLSLYYDNSLADVTGGIRVGRYLYYSQLSKSYISRIDLTKLPAVPTHV